MSIPRPITIPNDLCSCCKRYSKVESDSESELDVESDVESDVDSDSDSDSGYSWDSVSTISSPNPNQKFYPGDILRFYPSLSERHYLSVITSDMRIHEILRADKFKKIRYTTVDDWCNSMNATRGDIYINHQRPLHYRPEIANVKPRDIIRYYPDPIKSFHKTAVVLIDGTIYDCNRKIKDHAVKYDSADKWYQSLTHTKNGSIFINKYAKN